MALIETKKFTQPTKNLCLEAERIAQYYRQEVLPEHLFSAICTGNISVGKEGISLTSKVCSKVSELLRSGDRPDVLHPEWSNQALYLLSQARQCAIERGHDYVATEHVIYALFDVAEKAGGPLYELMANAGFNPETGKRKLEHILNWSS